MFWAKETLSLGTSKKSQYYDREGLSDSQDLKAQDLSEELLTSVLRTLTRKKLKKDGTFCRFRCSGGIPSSAQRSFPAWCLGVTLDQE